MKHKFIFSGIGAFFLLQGSLFGEESSLLTSITENISSGEEDITTASSEIAQIEKSQNCLIKKYPEDYQILQSAQGCRERLCGPYISVSAMIWQSKLGNMEYAAKFKTIDPSNINSIKKQYFAIPDFAWRPGFKLDAGYRFQDDNWDIRTLWTYYRGEFTHVKKHTNVELYPEDNGVVPLYFISPFTGNVSPSPRFSHATGDWCVYFNSIDCELARNFFVRRKLSVRLLFGLKGAWINQEYRIDYSVGNNLVGPYDNLTYYNSYINFKNKYWGFGPRIGFESKCHLKWGFKLLANTSLATLMSHFFVTRNEHDLIHNNTTLQDIILPLKSKSDFYTMKPTIQLLLGFEWSRCFRQSFLGFSMAYEMQYFFGQNQMKRPTGSPSSAQGFINRGDLQLHGLTTNLKYEF